MNAIKYLIRQYHHGESDAKKKKESRVHGYGIRAKKEEGQLSG
jgi:hypothetical protein